VREGEREREHFYLSYFINGPKNIAWHFFSTVGHTPINYKKRSTRPVLPHLTKRIEKKEFSESFTLIGKNTNWH